MGCSSSSAQDRFAVVNPTNNYHLDIEQRISPLLNTAHAANINNKYIHIAELIPNKNTNTGIYRTNAYLCLVSQDELQRYRSEFWGMVNRNKNRRIARCLECSKTCL